MQRSTSRILTTHTGSLPRPRELTRLYALRARGEAVAEAEIDRLGRDAVRAVVRKQRQAGIDVGNNGEQQRDSFFLYLKNRLSGLGGSWERPSRADIDRYPDFQRLWSEQHASKTQVSALGGLPKAIGAVRYLDARAINDECRVFKDVLAENPGVFAEPFMSAPSPGILATAVRNEHYDTLANYLAALGAALQVEYEAIVNHGLLLQIDAPDLALERHITYKDRPVSAFVDFVEQVVATINRALVNVPRDRVRLHVCWGNYEGPHDHDIDFRKIAPILVKAKPQALVVEAANPRHAHEWAVWNEVKLPADKLLIPGVLDTSTNYVEHPDLVAQRLCQFADSVGRERIIAATDCGFETFAGYDTLDRKIVFKKLESMVEGARIASKRLWR